MGDVLAGIGGSVWTLLSFVVALSVIVTIHEYGHYIVARWCGIRAETFSLGMGPRLWGRRDRRGTMWQVAALPIGGYVRFLGDADAASAGRSGDVAQMDASTRRQTLDGAPLWARVATVAAGPVFNFILSILVFAGFMLSQGVAREQVVIGQPVALPGAESGLRPGDQVLALDGRRFDDWPGFFAVAQQTAAAARHDWTVLRDGRETTVSGPDPMPPLIGAITPRSAAARAGLRSGQVITRINDQPVHRFSQLSPVVTAAQGQPVTLTVWSPDGQLRQVSLAPKQQDLPRPGGGFERRWLIGITGGQAFVPQIRAVGPVEALKGGVQQTWGVIAASVTGMAAMIGGQISSCNLGGAISIAESTGQAASAGGGQFLWWIAILSAAIGFLNLLPIPVLDGGHLAFYAWEAVTGRKPSDRVMNALTALGLAAVITLMIFGLTNDLFCP
ncbi:RIP metalloprotease RseP [Paracoccus jiaweipingae]|uniref:RIP metalloprotease RseP n=1 Tax=unclassified Paracoccus (in: a-proteobacteria) TaxID=2688777 RepID=UPI0037974DFA